ncbi:zinc finger CCCH domain-containing protein 12-like [Hibiscus syriacus]|uniref:Zinc finger CCCH domain-containing protein 12-like n=1 Tax=Hibiscus syriacus TaxID=106335 RepID=A0A6A2ZPV9_HIBSY|nr:uncharacterized protein LOC120140632 [Hibiscus syriacus]KAE8693918.1 zinc finger CCCH domain-containing protein 12-like [Hibiscus syriacus]
MKAVILRGGSIPVTSPALAASSSPRVSLSRQSSFAGIYSTERTAFGSPLISLLSPMDKRKAKETQPHIRRALSDSDIVRSASQIPVGSRGFSAGIPEEECLSDCEVDWKSRALVTGNGSDRVSFAPFGPERGISKEEIGYSGDGVGNGGKSGGNHGDDPVGHTIEIGDYYKEMLKLNPADSLLLRNYGRFLHEVEKDTERAEEYYGRAILVSPGDGEVLSLYAKLIWERLRDKSRASSYFDRAITASPDDCMVLGSYAHFMWEAEEDDNEEDELGDKFGFSPPMVSAF